MVIRGGRSLARQGKTLARLIRTIPKGDALHVAARSLRHRLRHRKGRGGVGAATAQRSHDTDRYARARPYHGGTLRRLFFR